MQDTQKILLVGCGELGGIILEYMCRIPGIGEIVVTDVNTEWGRRKVNSAILGASYLNLYPKIRFQKMDLLDVGRTAEQLRDINPCIILNGTTLQSWWVVNEIPPELNKRLYQPKVGLGAWVAMHLALTARLMEAVKAAGIDTHVVNTSFPDVTNVSLHRVGMAPTVGIGNGDLLVSYIRKTCGEMFNVPLNNITVDLIAHHYHAYNWARAGAGSEAPYYLKVYLGRQEITPDLGDAAAFIAKLPRHAGRPPGRHGQFLVAASALKNLLAIYFDTGELTMAPGPQGLEGGYPVRLNRQGARVVLPADISLEQARDLMLEAQRYDGIKAINDQGDIVLTPEAAAMLSKELSVDWSVVTIKDAYDQAMELRSKFRQWLQRNGVNLPQ